jgi:maltose alpha-D-glucosyltransferase/alpha-amylase
MGQVLQTGKDFVIIDFEGEPDLPLSLRRIKRNALRDVASMLRSFHHAPYAVLLGSAPGTTVRTLDVAALETAADYWHRWVSAIYLGSYLDTARDAAFVPQTREELSVLLDVFLLDRMLDEVTQELTLEHTHPTEWLRIPLRGILQVAGGG